MDKPTCCFCGDTENLHPYGQTDPGFDKDPTAAARVVYACNRCDPLSVTRDKIEALAYALIGTCDDPSEALLESLGLPLDFQITDCPIEYCIAFDCIVMRCVDCGWWCDACDIDERGYCGECSRGED